MARLWLGYGYGHVMVRLGYGKVMVRLGYGKVMLCYTIARLWLG